MDDDDQHLTDVREREASDLAIFKQYIFPVYREEGFTLPQAYQCFLMNHLFCDDEGNDEKEAWQR